MTSAQGETLPPARRAPASIDLASAVLLLFATVATGLVAGFFYAYACSVMVGLARTDDLTFISTMQGSTRPSATSGSRRRSSAH